MSPTAMEEERALYRRAIFDGTPIPLFIVDEDLRIIDFNTAAEEMLGPESVIALNWPCGVAFHCVHAEPTECGKAEACHACAIRTSVYTAASGEPVRRKMHIAKFRTPNRTVTQEFLISATLLPFTETPEVLVALEDISSIGALRKARKS
jgi:PAS domain-containing protein